MNHSVGSFARSPDGSLNHEFYRDSALDARSEYLAAFVPEVPKIAPATRRRLGVFAAAFALATGAFWTTMLTDPPTTEASGGVGYSIGEVLSKAPGDLPSHHADAI